MAFPCPLRTYRDVEPSRSTDWASTPIFFVESCRCGCVDCYESRMSLTSLAQPLPQLLAYHPFGRKLMGDSSFPTLTSGDDSEFFTCKHTAAFNSNSTPSKQKAVCKNTHVYTYGCCSYRLKEPCPGRRTELAPALAPSCAREGFRSCQHNPFTHRKLPCILT